jgi:hypothetical protein
MKVVIGGECSGVIREEFRKRGHDAFSIDFKPTEIPGQHIQGDVRKHARKLRPDLFIAHPDCDRLARSGARWLTDPRFPNWKQEQDEAVIFFMEMVNMGFPKQCTENSIGIMSSRFRPPDQIIQPWLFGHRESKATCLWLKNLPNLIPTNIVGGAISKVHLEPPSPERKANRARTLQGIAKAMAEQWG